MMKEHMRFCPAAVTVKLGNAARLQSDVVGSDQEDAPTCEHGRDGHEQDRRDRGDDDRVIVQQPEDGEEHQQRPRNK